MYRALLPTALSLTLVAQLTAQSAVAAGAISSLISSPQSPLPTMLKPLNDFTAYSTGQRGIALADIVNVQINYGVGDTGIVDDGGSMVTVVFWKDHYKTFKPSELSHSLLVCV